MSFEIVNLLHTVAAVQPFVRIPQRTYLNFQFHAHHSEKMDFWFGSSIWCALMHSQPCRFHWKKCNLLRKNRACILLSDISIVEMHWSVTLFISLRSSSTSFDAVRCCVVWHCWFRCNLKWALSIWRDLLSTDTSMSKCVDDETKLHSKVKIAHQFWKKNGFCSHSFRREL